MTSKFSCDLSIRWNKNTKNTISNNTHIYYANIFDGLYCTALLKLIFKILAWRGRLDMLNSWKLCWFDWRIFSWKYIHRGPSAPFRAWILFLSVSSPITCTSCNRGSWSFWKTSRNVWWIECNVQKIKWVSVLNIQELLEYNQSDIEIDTISILLSGNWKIWHILHSEVMNYLRLNIYIWKTSINKELKKWKFLIKSSIRWDIIPELYCL